MDNSQHNEIYNASTRNRVRAFVVDEISNRVRARIYVRISKRLPLGKLSRILDIGVTADKTFKNSNFFEQLFDYPGQITALSDQNAAWMEGAYPGLRFVRGDALSLPFMDGSFDLVFSSAVLEHVGSQENQFQMISEACRVSRRYVCMVTPNRWHPIEFHTNLPLLHWLPRPMYRSVLKAIHLSEYADPNNLNLCDLSGLATLCRRITSYDVVFTCQRFLFFKSNIILLMTKRK